MQTKGRVLCEEQYQQWGNTPGAAGVAPFTGMSQRERQFAREVWQHAWSAAVVQAARSQEDRSAGRHGYDKHGDGEALLRALGFEQYPVETEEY